MKLMGTQKEEKAEVQMAPLIDCVFILLIFFLVTSMLQKPHNELAVDVPVSGAGEVRTEQQEEALVIVVTSSNPDGAAASAGEGPKMNAFIVMDGEEVNKQLLDRRLRQVAQQNPNRRIRIDSDGFLAWRHLIPVLDLCRFHGLTRVDVRTI
jgi:biopolymer transport protein ExbD